MEVKETIDLAAKGLVLAAFIRWFLNIEVSFIYAAVVGSLSLLSVPWVVEYLGQLTINAVALPSAVVGGIITSVALVISQVIRFST